MTEQTVCFAPTQAPYFPAPPQPVEAGLIAFVTGPYLFTCSEVQRGEGVGEMSTTAASNREDVKKPHVHPTGIETQVDVMAGSHSTWRKYSYAHTSHSVTPRVSPRITSCVQQYLGGIETASGKKLLSRNSHTQRERNFRNHKVLIMA